jgi:hypothetical protein
MAEWQEVELQLTSSGVTSGGEASSGVGRSHLKNSLPIHPLIGAILGHAHKSLCPSPSLGRRGADPLLHPPAAVGGLLQERRAGGGGSDPHILREGDGQQPRQAGPGASLRGQGLREVGTTTSCLDIFGDSEFTQTVLIFKVKGTIASDLT